MKKRALALSLLLAAAPAAADEVTVYCSVLIDWCNVAKTAFERETGVKVTLTQKGSGETLAQLRAEAANPRADVWWGGTGDPHLQAAELGLSEAYRSPRLPELHPWAQRQAEQSQMKSVGIYLGILGFTYNTELLEKKKLAPPQCWKDLLESKWQDEVQISNPASSGTAYTAVATLVQVMGEEPAFEYLKKLHRNVGQYTRSGPAPARNAARGETAVGIMFLHDAVAEAIGGFPLKMQAPCEGTGYEVGSMSLVKGGRNPEAAKRWYDWSLSPEAQNLAVQGKSYQMPSNKNARMPPDAPRPDAVKLVDYDFAKYGASAERKRLIERWEKEVGSAPK